MSRHRVFSFFIIFSLISFTLPVFARGTDESSDYLVFDVGMFNAQNLGIAHSSKESAQFGIAYKAREIGYNFAPIAGLRLNKLGGTFTYAGMSWNQPVYFDEVIFAPSFSVGLYTDGGGPQIGGPFNFRSGLELSYEFENTSRFGVAWEHISNADIYDVNAGYESTTIVYSLPISTIKSVFSE